MKSPALPRLQLGDAQPLASGRYRLIFQHPDNDDLLVKVSRNAAPLFGAPTIPPPSPRPSEEIEKTIRRELKEYASLRRKGLHELSFIQRFYGAVETDYGPGMVVEKLRGKDGGLAPTVTSYVLKNGLTNELRRQMLELRDEVIENNIIFTDVSGTNIVLAHDKHGQRLVIIDGLGDRLWLPVNSMFALINRYNRRRHFERAFEVLELKYRMQQANAAK